MARRVVDRRNQGGHDKQPRRAGLWSIHSKNLIKVLLVIVTPYFFVGPPAIAAPIEINVEPYSFSREDFGPMRIKIECKDVNDQIRTTIDTQSVRLSNFLSRPKTDSLLDAVKVFSRTTCLKEAENSNSTEEVPTEQVVNVADFAPNSQVAFSAWTKGGFWRITVDNIPTLSNAAFLTDTEAARTLFEYAVKNWSVNCIKIGKWKASGTAFKSLKIWSDLGLIQLITAPQPQGFQGWDNWLNQIPNMGKEPLIDVEVRSTNKGDTYDKDADNSDPKRLCMKGGSYNNFKVIRNDEHRIGSDRYAVLFMTYTAEYAPIFLQYIRATGGSSGAELKIKALLKEDVFSNIWTVVAYDFAERNANFHSDFVNESLSRLR